MKPAKKIAALLVTGVFMALAIASTEDTESKPPAPTARTPLGSPATCGAVEVTIREIKTGSRVAGVLEDHKPSEGGIYVMVDWAYKNTSKKPLGMMDRPSLSIVSEDGVEYEEDIGAASSYAAENDDDEKILSDLNPGLTSRSSALFEVSKELFNEETWSIKVTCDDAEQWFKMK